MTIKLKIASILAGLHLVLAILFIAHFGDWGLKNNISNYLFYLGEFTGSSNIYSFFAPQVGDQISVLYTLVDSSGKEKPWMLQGETPEVNTRIATVYNFVRLPEGEELFCRSFGNNALRMNPDANKVRVLIIQQTMPTLKAYSDSLLMPRWEPISMHDYIRQDN